MIGFVTNLLLLVFLVFILALVIRARRLFAVVVLAGAYSLVSAAMFVNLDAVDVAFTEAAVGAGISTVLFLAAMAYLPGQEKPAPDEGVINSTLLAALICVGAGILLIAAAIELPVIGDPNAPAHVHVAPRFIEESGSFLHIPNVVTTVLASYRGFDTLGETIVVYAAGLGVVILLSGHTRTARTIISGVKSVTTKTGRRPSASKTAKKVKSEKTVKPGKRGKNG